MTDLSVNLKKINGVENLVTIRTSISMTYSGYIDYSGLMGKPSPK